MLALFNSMELSSRTPIAFQAHLLSFVVAQCQEKVGTDDGSAKIHTGLTPIL